MNVTKTSSHPHLEIKKSSPNYLSEGLRYFGKTGNTIKPRVSDFKKSVRLIVPTEETIETLQDL
jgi:hypothetical protein